MSQPDSTLGASPSRGVLVKKPATSIYTVLMILATVAMTVSCILFSLVLSKYS